MRRWLLIWLALFGAYAATLGLDAFGASDYGGDEPHYLLVAESIVSDGDTDLTDEYLSRAYSDWYPYGLAAHGEPTEGRLNEPHGVGFPLLIALPYAIGGPIAVELFLAAIAALAFVLAAILARRLVPEPWATAAPVIVGLSPPALAYSTAVLPEMAAGALIAGSAIVALRLRESPRLRTAAVAGLLLAPLPWLGPKYAVPGAIVLAAIVRWLWRRNRGTVALIAAEIPFASLVAYVTVNGQLYGGTTPFAAELPGRTVSGAEGFAEHAERAHRLLGMWLDREVGLLRWAPFLALAGYAAWLLWRSRRERVARTLPERTDVEAAAGLLLAACAGQIAVAAFVAPTMFGFGFGGRQLICVLPLLGALCAWGLRHAPRTGAALGGLTILASAWLMASLRIEGGGLSPPDSAAPWGPLENVFPQFGQGRAWADVVIAAAIAGLAALALLEWRRARSAAGETEPGRP